MKLLLVCVLVAVFSAANCLTDEELGQQWSEYKTKFNRQYKDAQEENFRKQLFATRVRDIEEHNKKYEQGLVTYTQGVNMFTDRTEEEMRPYTHGLRIPQNARSVH